MEAFVEMSSSDSCSRVVNASDKSEQELDKWFYTTGEVIMIVIINPIISLTGILSNSGLLIVIYRVSEMRTVMNIYLGNLAVADLLYSLFSFVDHIWTYSTSDGIIIAVPYRTTFACLSSMTIVHVSLYASMALVHLVSWERYLAVCKPLKHRQIANKTRTVRMVAFVWLIAFVLTAIVAPSWTLLVRICTIWPLSDKYDHLPNVIYHCAPVLKEFKSVHDIGETIFFLTTLTICIVCFVRMIRHLNKRIQTYGEIHSVARAQKTRNQVSRMVIVNALVFFISLGPIQFHNFYDAVGFSWLDVRQYFTLLWVARLFGGINSAVNPFLYTAINSRYRDAFKTVFCCAKETVDDHDKTLVKSTSVEIDTRV